MGAGGEYLVFLQGDGKEANERVDSQAEWIQPSAEDYEEIFPILASLKFPTCLLFPPPRNVDSASRNDSQQARIREGIRRVSPQLDIVFVPSTFFELFFIYEYLRGRAFTRCQHISSQQESFGQEFFLGCIRTWMMDHRTTHPDTRISEEFFYEKAKEVVLEDFTAFTSYELNGMLLKFIQASSLWKTYAGCVGDNQFELWRKLLRERLEVLIEDLKGMEQGRETEWARAYDEWLLRSPDFEERFLDAFFGDHSMGEEKEEVGEKSAGEVEALFKVLKRVYLQQLSPHVYHMKDLVRSCMASKGTNFEAVKEYLGDLVAGRLFDRDNEKTRDDEGCCKEREEVEGSRGCSEHMQRLLYMFLVETLYPRLFGYVAALEERGYDDHTLLALKRRLCPESVVDPCVHSFRKKDYLRRTDIIFKAFEIEMGTEGEDDFFVLYRGTRNPSLDGSVLVNSPATTHRDVDEDDEGDDGGEEKTYYPSSHHDRGGGGKAGLKGRRRECTDKTNPWRAHSLSLGMGLFSGILKDETATPYNYMRKKGIEGYAVKIYLREYYALVNKLVWVPPLPRLVQLGGIGEMFHPRSKVFVGGAEGDNHATTSSCYTATLTEADGEKGEDREQVTVGRDSRTHFVSGILKCSYYLLPDFLRTEREHAHLVKSFLNERALPLGLFSSSSHFLGN